MNPTRKTATNWISAISLLTLIFSTTAFNAHAAPFRASADGSSVFDEATNLVWVRCAVGQMWDKKTCTGDAKSFTFDQAVLAAKQTNTKDGFAGFKDWIVPTVRQLATLRMCSDGFSRETSDIQDGAPRVFDTCATLGSLKPAIDINIFPATPNSDFWSSSPYVGGNGKAWGVNFLNGQVYNDSTGNNLHVRLVRASKLSVNEVTLAFPVRLTVMSKSDIARALQAQKQAQKEFLKSKGLL